MAYVGAIVSESDPSRGKKDSAVGDAQCFFGKTQVCTR